MKFSPANAIVRLCMQAMALEDGGQRVEARALVLRAWSDASDDHERLLAAYHLARLDDDADPLHWPTVALDLARAIDDPAVRAAVPWLHERIAAVHARRNDPHAAEQHRALAASHERTPHDPGPFFHGTRADLRAGDLLTAGNLSNYEDGLVMNHIYFTALVDGAGLAAALCRGDATERVYVVEPTGIFEDDPNVTNVRFPGNPTRSYRSAHPLKVVGEVSAWERPAPEVIARWRARAASRAGEIVN